MKKIIVLLILIVALAAAGCADYSGGESAYMPNETVLMFVDSFESNDVNACYSMMSKQYRKDYDAQSFVQMADGYKDEEAHNYEFIEVKDFTAVEDAAVVDIIYNQKKSLVGISWENSKEKQIELVKENGGWKFKEFPIELI